MEKDHIEANVLFVDDEKNILNALRRELMDEDYNCLFAESGNQALKILQKEKVSVIVCDMRMPEMDGLRLLKVVKEQYPLTVRVVLSGYTQMQQILITINQAEIFKFLIKPWGEELRVVIRQAVDYYRLLSERETIQKSLKNRNEAYQSILKNMENIVFSAKMSNVLFSAMGMKALEMADEALDNPQNVKQAKKQLSMASALLSTLAKMDFEEYREVQVGTFCENISNILRADEKTDTVEIEKTPSHYEIIKTRNGFLTQFILTVINSLTVHSNTYSVRIKPNIVKGEQSRQIELSFVISENTVDDRLLQYRKKEEQKDYINMLNVYAAKVLSLLNGDFQGMMVNDVIILKLVVNDHSGNK